MLDAGAIEQSLRSVLAGDAAAVQNLEGCPQERLVAAQARIGQMVLTRRAVRRVVDSLRSAAISPNAAQAWASFVRRGYVASERRRPVRPLDIEFERLREDQIADVVARLDEMGDVIDGELDVPELIQMAQQLDDS